MPFLTQSNSVHGKLFKVYPKGCDTLDAKANLDTYNKDCFTNVGRSSFIWNCVIEHKPLLLISHFKFVPNKIHLNSFFLGFEDAQT